MKKSTPATRAGVLFQEGQGDLPMLEIRTAWSTAVVYLHGAHVTHFQKAGEPPLLFLSKMSRFTAGEPIRGGVPVILPWFGAREGQPSHGFARLLAWHLEEVTFLRSGEVNVRLRLPTLEDYRGFTPFAAEYNVTIGRRLRLALSVTNATPDRELVLEDCLHTYFAVSDIARTSVAGLRGVRYLDTVGERAERVETARAIRFTGETDRIYLHTPHTIEIHDRGWKRRIVIEKEGAATTVVWNPWIEKAQRMPDFGNEEYRQMVCVESGNAGPDRLTLAGGQTAALAVTLSSAPLAAGRPAGRARAAR